MSGVNGLSASPAPTPSPDALKHVRQLSVSDAGTDAHDVKRVKVEPGEEEAVTASGVGVAGGGDARDASSHHSTPALATRVSTSTPTPPHTVSLSSPKRESEPPAPASTAAAGAAAPSPTPPAAASSTERKALPKEKTSLLKAAVDRSKRKDKPKKRSDKDKENRDARPPRKENTPAAGAEDDDAYCVCKGANRDDDTFIGCDNCDGWFHPGCMGIDEERVEALDMFICPPCETATGKTTIYKRMCKREGCGRTARAASKYCSPKCAFLQAQAVLASVDKKDVASLGTDLAGYPSPGPPVTVELFGPPGRRTDGDNGDKIGTWAGAEAAKLLANLQTQSDDVARLAELVARRQALFAQAIAQWDELKPVQTSDPPPAPKRKSKAKKREGDVVVERPCGWDSRLLWNDDEVRAWDGSGPDREGRVEGDGDVEMAEQGGGGGGGGGSGETAGGQLLSTMCPAGRRCERHQGWQKTLGVGLDVEAALLARKKDEINAMIERVVRWEEAEAAAAKTRTEVRSRIKR